MANLTKQTRKVAFILSLKGYEDYEILQLKNDLKKYFDNCCDFYAFILHDKDTILDANGEFKEYKTPHIHCVCWFDTGYAKTRLSTHLANLSSTLQFNPFGITINYAKDFIGNVCYLIHKNDEEKFPYDRNEIVTNDIGLLNDYLDSESDLLSAERLVKICKDCDYNKVKIMFKLTPSIYAHYRPTICDIIEDFVRRR